MDQDQDMADRAWVDRTAQGCKAPEWAEALGDRRHRQEEADAAAA